MKGYILRCAKCNEPLWSFIPTKTYEAFSPFDQHNPPPYLRYDYCPNCNIINPIFKAEKTELKAKEGI